MKVYITKYALTQGITEHEAEVYQDIPTMIRLTNAPFQSTTTDRNGTAPGPKPSPTPR